MEKIKNIIVFMLLFCILIVIPLNLVFADETDINMIDIELSKEEELAKEVENIESNAGTVSEDNQSKSSDDNIDTNLKDKNVGDKETRNMVSQEGDIIPAENMIQTTQDYIKKNINADYARLIKFEAADALLVKQTFAQKSLMPKDNLTINGLWERKEGDDIESFGRAFITVNESAVYMYNTDDESRYFVAYINPMVDDSGIETTDVVFAKNNLNGEVYNDCIYDSRTGIAYIPKKYNTEAVGKIIDEYGNFQEFSGVYFNSQCQLLQLVNSKESTCEVDVIVEADNVENDIEKEISTEGAFISRIIDMETTINITDTPELLNSVLDEEISVYVDDGEIPWDNITIDRGNGTVTIPVAPSNIDSVRIEIQGKTVFTKIMDKLTGMIKPLKAAAATVFFAGKSVNTLPLIWRYKGSADELKNILSSTSSISRENTENFGVVYDRTQIQPGIDTTNSELYLKARQDISYMLGKLDENPSVYHPDGTTPDYYHDITDKGRPLADYIMGRGAIPDLDSMNNSVNPMFSIILPNEFSLSAGGESIDIVLEDEKDNPNLKYVKRNDGCVVLPMQCVHIESPLGVKGGTSTMWTNTPGKEELEAAKAPHEKDILAVRALDYRIDENGSGEVLISVISQRAFDQTGISIFAVPFKRATGGLQIKKSSSNSPLTFGNPLYSFSGLTFGVYEDNGGNSIENAKNDVQRIGTLICDEKGNTNALDNLIPGDYLVKELENTARQKSGYKLNSKIYKANVKMDSTALIEAENIPKAEPVRIKIQKADPVTGKLIPQGLGSFKGAEYTVKYYSVFPDDTGKRDVNNKIIYKDPALNAVVPLKTWIYVTNNEGMIELSDKSYRAGGDELFFDKNNQVIFPMGTITIEETKASHGHDVEKSKYVFLVDGEVSTVIRESLVVKEPVIYGGIFVTKYDTELDKSEGLLNDGLSNIEFSVYNNSGKAIAIRDKVYNNGEIVSKIKTTLNKKQGKYTASTGRYELPTGNYIVKESKSNPAYNINDTFYNIEIGGTKDCHGKLVNLDINGKELIFKNSIKRRDVEFEKVADSSLKRLSVAFLLTNNNTKESHIVVSDENGELDTSSSFNKHDYMTNDNDRLYFDEEGKVIYDETNPIKSEDINTESGVYFGIGENGSKVKPDNNLGALPYGEYTLRELRCEDNIGFKLLNIDFKVTRDMPARPVDLSTVTNDPEELPSVKKYIVNKGELVTSKMLVSGEEYRYRLYLQANDSNISNIEFIDMIEKSGGVVLGKYRDIDISNLIKSGFNPEISYTGDNGKSWNSNPDKYVDGVKISLDKTLNRGESVYIDILMTAPKEALNTTAYNDYTLFYHGGGIKSNQVSVSIEKRENLEIPKLGAPPEAENPTPEKPVPKEEYSKIAGVFPVPKTGEGLGIYLAILLLIAGIVVVNIYERIKRRKDRL